MRILFVCSFIFLCNVLSFSQNNNQENERPRLFLSSAGGSYIHRDGTAINLSFTKEMGPSAIDKNNYQIRINNIWTSLSNFESVVIQFSKKENGELSYKNISINIPKDIIAMIFSKNTNFSKIPLKIGYENSGVVYTPKDLNGLMFHNPGSNPDYTRIIE